MQIIRSRRLATVAFSILSSSRRGYPPEDGAHIAIREFCKVIINDGCHVVMVTGTVRRFLEHYGDNIDVVVFVADSEEVRGHILQ